MSAVTLAKRHRNLLGALLLLAAVTLVYLPGLGGGYAFDDFPNIVFNRNLHVERLDWASWVSAAFSSPASAIQRPLAMLTFAANHYFTGLAPAPMKMTNLLVHAVNTLLVLALARALLRSRGRQGPAVVHDDWIALFVAAAWALHPINAMPVLFVVQRMESLCHTFVFAGLWLYLGGRQRMIAGKGGWGRILCGLVLGTGLGLLSKESAVLLPLYAFCIELCLLGFRGSAAGTGRRLHALFAIVLFVPGVLGAAWATSSALEPGTYAARSFTLPERLLTEGRVVMDYLRWSLFPSLRELGLHHDDYTLSRSLLDPPSTLVSLVGIAGLVLAALLLRRTRPLTSLGVLWFFGAHLLTATVIPLELVHEHRNYFASLGVCLVAADLLLLAGSGRSTGRIRLAVAVLALCFLGMTTHLRAREWNDPVRFAVSEAAKHPQSPRAVYTAGQTLIIASQYRPETRAFHEGIAALERARALPDSGILPHSSLLLVAARTGRPFRKEWWRDMQEKLREGSVGPQELNAIASIEQCASGKGCSFPAEDMLATLDAAMSHGPNAEVLSMYGDYVLNVMNDPALATRFWRAAVDVQPTVAQYRINLIKLLIARNQTTDACRHIQRLRRAGRLGQHQDDADALERRLRGAAPANRAILCRQVVAGGGAGH